MEKQERSNRLTGLDLKFARLARGVQAREIARSLGVSPQRVSAIEAAFRPSAPMVARYLAALDAVASSEVTGQVIGALWPTTDTGSGEGVGR
jgi:transcriptional regulator with XRE-family HTH domain